MQPFSASKEMPIPPFDMGMGAGRDPRQKFIYVVVLLRMLNFYDNKEEAERQAEKENALSPLSNWQASVQKLDIQTSEYIQASDMAVQNQMGEDVSGITLSEGPNDLPKGCVKEDSLKGYTVGFRGNMPTYNSAILKVLAKEAGARIEGDRDLPLTHTLIVMGPNAPRLTIDSVMRRGIRPISEKKFLEIISKESPRNSGEEENKDDKNTDDKNTDDKNTDDKNTDDKDKDAGVEEFFSMSFTG
ncbi:uncharacterized protein K452DRAFT_295200 [Aplosporella prunicola CBS 121167]|uniref:BRCT domain-containing protein n=1 Tax=Aplosporella prunicola CBS 121167 TaxID=1176127 RepID=A0A6A6BQS8_9PEZI|nr:uncharacterized protein K452DRAFT_295200 [Aplosporella prunicola CBS 121167]KAF2145594.1 hypothetical protein K452DRAFT_295200 [Aplosporella prunicola CBS 121167]